MRRTCERAHFMVARVVLRRLVLERLAIRAENDPLRPIHGADDQRRPRRSPRHPPRWQQRTQHHRGKREMDGSEAQIADHGRKISPRPTEIKRQCAA